MLPLCMRKHHQCVLKVTGGSFHHHNFWGDLSAWVVYKMGIVGYLRSSARANKTTHNTQQTHNDKMSRRNPTLKRLCPLSPWQQPRQHRLLVPPLPMDPGQAQGAWLLLAVLAGSYLGHRYKPHPKIDVRPTKVGNAIMTGIGSRQNPHTP